jgi:hypothetical protein
VHAIAFGIDCGSNAYGVNVSQKTADSYLLPIEDEIVSIAAVICNKDSSRKDG